MKSAFSCVACVVACTALLVFVGCSGADPKTSAKEKLVGSWKGEIKPEIEADEGSEGVESMIPDEPMSVEMKFQDDGTMTMDMPLFGAVSGKWEVIAAEEKKATINAVLNFPSFEVQWEQSGEGPDAEAKETTKVEYEEQSQELSVVFETDNRITVTPSDDPSSPMTLDRQ